MRNFSLTTNSILILFVSFMKEGLGVDFTTSEYETAITVVIGIVVAVSAWYGRVRAGGINWVGKRKTE